MLRRKKDNKEKCNIEGKDLEVIMIMKCTLIKNVKFF